jgi:hypothetical protein
MWRIITEIMIPACVISVIIAGLWCAFLTCASETAQKQAAVSRNYAAMSVVESVK